jgi:phosphoribosylamine--glycine ligase
MRIFVIGAGGREHALAWRLAREGHQILAAPGNPGIAQAGEVISSSDFRAIAESKLPDLTIVGPEAPLVAGIVDQFRDRGVRIVGATQEMAKLESSKIHAKEFMLRAGIPTARFERAETHEDALRVLGRFDYPIVIKADGLAAGKGVIVAQDRHTAESAIHALGPALVIEEFLQGEEVSFIVVSDGHSVIPLEATQDHKAVGDDDTGPNTGGMGAYCDGRILTPTDCARILDTIIEPTVAATGFRGFLYAGLMMTSGGPKVLEFNVRLGDPETQPLMHRLSETTSLADVLTRAASGSLRGAALDWKPEPSVCVVLAAAGYPQRPRTGDPISGLPDSNATVFHAGTKIGRHGLETAGGRVLGVTSSGPNLAAAIQNTYAAVSRVQFDGMHYRSDIGRKGLKRWPPATI